MKRAVWVILAVGILAAPVRAQDTLFFDSYCSVGSFEVCASVRLFSGPGNVLRMQVWNLQGMLGVQHTMTAIGLYHSGTAWAGTVNSYTVVHQLSDDPEDQVDITGYWTEGGAESIGTLAGFQLELREGTRGNAGIIGCVDPGGSPDKWETCMSFDGAPYVEFTFRLSEQWALAETELRWHSQQLPDESSIKCDTGGAGDYPPCMPTTVVPEPATLLLVGTGLAGVAAAARRRRRKAESDHAV